jgi:hypothetical protein
MLFACNCILEPGRKIRILTPDLKALLALRTSKPDDIQKKYIRWITDNFIAGDIYRASLVIKNAFRNWGHQFLYDKKTLELALRQAGFNDLEYDQPGESDDENLHGLEGHGASAGSKEMNPFCVDGCGGNLP